MSTNLKFFVSHSREDKPIAVSIKSLLKSQFGEKVSDVFIDTHSIGPGEEIPKAINKSLESSDILVVVHTGLTRETFDWPGYELGFFEGTAKRKSSDSESEIRGKVYAFCRAGKPPAPISSERYVSLAISDDYLELEEEAYAQSLETLDDPSLLMFLYQIHFALHGSDLSNDRDADDRLRRKIREFKIGVFRELKKRVRLLHKPQYQLLVRYNGRNISKKQFSLPENARIISIGGTLELFGINQSDPRTGTNSHDLSYAHSTELGRGLDARELSWSDFKQMVSDSSLGAHWVSSISRVLVSAGTPSMNIDNSQVIMSADRRKRYRVLLTTATAYFNHDVEASIYLVESFSRRDYGGEETTKLLKGLQLACRYRFAFVEKASEIHWLNLTGKRGPSLQEFCRNVLAELDHLHAEAQQAELDRTAFWSEFIDPEVLQNMSDAWQARASKIREVCSQIVIERLSDPDENQARNELHINLKALSEEIQPFNAQLIRSMAEGFKSITSHDDKMGG